MRGQYALEKYRVATQNLASGTLDLRTRLRHAYIPALIALAGEDFPPELLQAHKDITRCFNTVDAQSGKGSIDDSVSLLSEAETRDLANNIVSLFEKLAGNAASVGKVRLHGVLIPI